MPSGVLAQDSALKMFPGAVNNSTVRLHEGKYKGDVEIKANKVTVIGQGIARTTIQGDVQITGNNCVMMSLTINGNVTITGNNVDLQAITITGKVANRGKNNKL